MPAADSRSGGCLSRSRGPAGSARLVVDTWPLDALTPRPPDEKMRRISEHRSRHLLYSGCVRELGVESTHPHRMAHKGRPGRSRITDEAGDAVAGLVGRG